MNNKILGLCKECGNELYTEDRIENYNIYECRNCKYPSHSEELIKVLQEKNKED